MLFSMPGIYHLCQLRIPLPVSSLVMVKMGQVQFQILSMLLVSIAFRHIYTPSFFPHDHNVSILEMEVAIWPFQ